MRWNELLTFFHVAVYAWWCSPGFDSPWSWDRTAIYKGTVNDPTTFPPPNRSQGSHHWAFERLLAASLLPITAAAFVTSGSAYPVFDGILGVSLVMHSHIGVCHPFADSVDHKLTKTALLFTIDHDTTLARRSLGGLFDESSLTTSWWTTYIHASSLSSAQLSPGF